MLSLPSDEVGNHLVDDADYFNANLGNRVIEEEEYRQIFGYKKHEFTGVDYVEYYKELAAAEGCEIKVVFNNNPTAILDYTNSVLYCDIHTRERTKQILLKFTDLILYVQSLLQQEKVAILNMDFLEATKQMRKD